MRDAVIVDAVRTPTGKRNGALKDWHPVDLSAHVLTALVERTGIDPALVDDVIWGVVSQTGEQSANVGRNAVVAGGCEVMSRVPMLVTMTQGPGEPFGPKMIARYDGRLVHQGIGAEMIAQRWGITREQCDEIAVASHERAAAAIDEGRFGGQYALVPVVGADGSEQLFAADEGVRRGSTMETLGALKRAFTEDGVVTAGNSSQISDGAAALLVMTSEKARELGLTPMARFHTFALAGVDPVTILTGPIPATAKALARSGLRLDEIGAIEVNEAFATVVKAWEIETGADMKTVNPNGGAIALGHPLGGSGARLMTTLVHHMWEHRIRYGLQTMCEGGGMANATILELL